MNRLFYDVEIARAIEVEGEERFQGVDYCEGWEDFAGMGVAVLCAYDEVEKRYFVFLEDGLKEFEKLAAERYVIGFNSIKFDDNVLAAAGIEVRTDYDLFVEVQRAAGLPEGSQEHGIYSLNKMAYRNGLPLKTGWGKYAPVQWQRGEKSSVINYCLHDVYLLRELVKLLCENGKLNAFAVDDSQVEGRSLYGSTVDFHLHVEMPSA